MNTVQDYIDCIPERDTEIDFQEWFEDASSEPDWIDNFNFPDSNQSCSALLDELHEKNKVLEKAWRDAEQKYQNLQVENQKLNIQFSNERHRSSKFQKKLQYIQDNQEMFTQVKHAYLSMKYNESIGRNMIEIRETGCQTDASNEHPTENFKTSTHPDSSELICVKRSEVQRLQQGVQNLKELIDKREQSWSFNAKMEKQYKMNISDLQDRLCFMTNLLKKQRDELNLEDNGDLMSKENRFLKKIIVKMEKRHTDLEKMHKIGRRPGLLSQQEKLMVQDLIRRYAHTLSQKATRSLSCGTKSYCSGSPMLHSLPILNFSRDLDGIGCGEGIVFNIPLPKRLCPSSRKNSPNRGKETEKPISPSKRDVMEQTNSLDFTRTTLSIK